MKAIIGALALMVALVMTPSALAQPAQDDLQRAILTSSEVGSGFTTYQDGPLEAQSAAGIPNYAAAYVRPPTLLNFTVTGVGVVLADAAAADNAGYTPEALLDQATGEGLTVTPIDSPGIGEESQRYAVSGQLFGIAIQGEAITWKEYGVRAAVFAMSNGASPSAMPHALRQSEKLASVFAGR